MPFVLALLTFGVNQFLFPVPLGAAAENDTSVRQRTAKNLAQSINAAVDYIHAAELPAAYGIFVIEAKLKVPANSLPESQYLLHAGSSERVGALDIRANIKDEPTGAAGSVHALAYLM
ncbi:hypothetical protein RBA41_22495, partial [Massilia sp. CCM 9210]|nr:hypothetical protein [Massilia sp. CCM 9210]